MLPLKRGNWGAMMPVSVAVVPLMLKMCTSLSTELALAAPVPA